MPELPEVETTKNAILPFKDKTLHRVIVNNPSLRWPVDEKAINKIKEVKRIAILPGSGTQFIDEIIEDVDIFVTGDISHRYLLKADDAGVGLLQIGHISSEIPGMKRFVNKLNNALSKELEYIYREFYE